MNWGRVAATFSWVKARSTTDPRTDPITPQIAAVDTDPTTRPPWTFLTNHGHVLVCLGQNPEVRLAEIARLVGIGERAAHRIVHELIGAGYVTRTKIGRRNRYELRWDRPLRHPLESAHTVVEVFEPLTRT